MVAIIVKRKEPFRTLSHTYLAQHIAWMVTNGIDKLTERYRAGFLGFLNTLLHPVFSFLGIPAELLPLICLRAVSGSGSLIIVQNIMETAGPDSYAGRAACVMAGGCETVIYVLALYFGVTRVRQMRHALAGGLVGYFTGVAVSLLVCRFL